MNRLSRFRWFWVSTLLLLALLAGLLWLRRDVVNVMHPALDRLAAVPLSERWSHPDLLKIRQLGAAAVPPLRRVLREKDSTTTHALLWVKAKWPGATNYFGHFPDPQRLSERRWTACQVLQTLGPAGRAAFPEILQILRSNDNGELNGATMALSAMGVDAEAREQLAALYESGMSPNARAAVTWALSSDKPPSPRTIRALTKGLRDPSSYVQERAAEAVRGLGVATPEIISGLKALQSGSTNDLVVLTASAALYDLQKELKAALDPVFRVLETELTNVWTKAPWETGNGGQGVNGREQEFMKAASLFARMNLPEAEKARALRIMEAFCERSDRIFIRMLLLPDMMRLGLAREKCVDGCRVGLAQEEEYYRLQAAQLFVQVAEAHEVPEMNLDAFIQFRDVGVRVYAARMHWMKKRQASVVVPVLVEALDRSRHQSYFYAEIQPTALKLLAEIGPEARDAVPALEKLAQDPNPAIVKLAAEALAKIRAAGPK